MSNWCSWQKTAAFTDAQWGTTNTAYVISGFSNPYSFFLAGKNALVTPFVFDADMLGISCVAFPSAGGSGSDLISLSSRVAALETANVNLQNQVTALSAGTVTQAPNPEIIEAMAVIFGATMVAAAAIYGLKSIYNLFRTRYASE